MKPTVWIVERNHVPLVIEERVVSFPCTMTGTNMVRAYLNTFPTSSEDSENYYDAVLYQSKPCPRKSA